MRDNEEIKKLIPEDKLRYDKIFLYILTKILVCNIFPFSLLHFLLASVCCISHQLAFTLTNAWKPSFCNKYLGHVIFLQLQCLECKTDRFVVIVLWMESIVKFWFASLISIFSLHYNFILYLIPSYIRLLVTEERLFWRVCTLGWLEILLVSYRE